MAIEYDLSSDADIDGADLVAFFETAVEGKTGQDGTVFRDGMSVTARRVPDGDEDSTSQLFGFDERSRATFRFHNLAPEATREHNKAVMVRAVLAFFERFECCGVLLFNGEVAVVQRLSGGTVITDDWREWLDGDEVAALVAAHQVGRLPQPLL